ncbi:peroxidase-like [Epargyreus clarus]|uniref:peroxidase-like n=1 Tax=Epargyreus clarus TaxID=520877 RepID=UPI003C2B087B
MLKVEFLSRLYDDVDDVDLITAIYIERLIPGGHVGPTLYCIITHNLLLWRHSDKFFFEHGGFPAALTEHQLSEVKSTSIAKLICDNGVGISQIQPHAFLRRSKWNNYAPCESIPGIDLAAWYDPLCKDEDYKKKK